MKPSREQVNTIPLDNAFRLIITKRSELAHSESETTATNKTAAVSINRKFTQAAR